MEFSGIILKTQVSFLKCPCHFFHWYTPQIMWIEEILFSFLQFCSSFNITCKIAIVSLEIFSYNSIFLKKNSRLAVFFPNKWAHKYKYTKQETLLCFYTTICYISHSMCCVNWSKMYTAEVSIVFLQSLIKPHSIHWFYSTNK